MDNGLKGSWNILESLLGRCRTGLQSVFKTFIAYYYSALLQHFLVFSLMTHQRGSPVKAQWLVCDPWIPSRYNDSLLCLPMPGCLGATRFLLPDTCPTMLPAFVARCRKGALQFIVQRW